MIGVIDYKAGNLKSVENALRFVGAKFVISGDPDLLMKSDKMIFPGVGHAASAMSVLHKTGLGQMLKEFAATGKPVLGLCLGSQIMLETSEEGDTACLGLIPGRSRLLAPEGLKVPHMGWNSVRKDVNHPIFKGIPDGAPFYFVHSYFTNPHSDCVLCSTEYGNVFTSGIYKDNISAVQFHPERSGKWGLKMLENFAAFPSGG